MFQKATKTQAWLRLALEGPAGYGKTYTALTVATYLAAKLGKRIAFLDTEAGSASKYADLFDFDVVEIDPPYHPSKFIQAIGNAEDMGYGVFVADSLSHFWNGTGGLLELVDSVARSKYRGDSHRAWGDEAAGGLQQKLTDAILYSRLHVIASMRTKKDYVRETVEKDGRERTVIRAAGTKTVQRDEFDYEFDVIGRFDSATNLAIVKSRVGDALPPESVFTKPGEDFAEILHAWTTGGASTDVTDEQKARLDAAIALGAKADPERFSIEKVEALAATMHRRPLDRLTSAEYEKVVAKIEAAAAEAESKPAEAAEETAADEASA